MSKCLICSNRAGRKSRYCGVHKKSENFKVPTHGRFSYVYLLDVGRDDAGYKFVKIGYSTKPWQRLKSLRASNPFCEYIAYARFEKGGRRFEAYLHKINQKAFYDREIFKLKTDDVYLVIFEMKRFGDKVHIDDKYKSCPY